MTNKIKVSRVDIGDDVGYYLEHIVRAMVEEGLKTFNSEMIYDIEGDTNGVIKGRVIASISVKFLKVSNPIEEYMKVMEEGGEVE